MATETQLIKSMVKELLIRVRDITANDQFMTRGDAAEYLGVSLSQFKIIMKNADIPKYKYGQIVRIRRKHLDEWLEQYKIN